jgi:hypothetical protein
MPSTAGEADLNQPLTRLELRAELRQLQSELRAELVAKTDLEAGDRLRTDCHAIAEGLRGDIRNLFDWMKSGINAVASRVNALETGHGARLRALETRITKLEANRNL